MSFFSIIIDILAFHNFSEDKMGKDLKGKELGKGYVQRKDSRYMARFRVKGRKDPIVLYNSDFKALKEETEAIKTRLQSGVLTDFTTMLMDDWFEEWMYIFNINLKDSTLSNYENTYNRVKKYLGHIQVRKLKLSNIQYAITCMYNEGYSYKTILSAKNLIYSMLQKAVQNGYIERNPCIGVVLPTNNTEEPQPLTAQELDRFFSAISNQRYKDLFTLLVNTGLRIGEACALTWDDIDFERSILKVSKTLNRTKQFNRKGQKITAERYRVNITSPKKQASNRQVPINPKAVAALLHWKQIQDNDKAKYGRDWGRNNYLLQEYPSLIFTTSPGGILSPSDAWDYCIQGANRVNEEELILAQIENRPPELLKIHPHIFRHTFATNCITSGMNPVAVMKIMGHTDIEMVQHYTHPDLDFIQKEYDNIFSKEEIVPSTDTMPSNTNAKIINFCKKRLH